jgi:MFS family permease
MDRSLHALRRKVLNTALTWTAVGAPLVAGGMLVQGPPREGSAALLLAMSGYTLCFPLLCLVAPRLSTRRLGSIYLALLLLMAFMIQLRGGISAAVASVQLIMIVLSALLFGARGGIVGLVASLACMSVAAVAVVGDHVPPIASGLWDPHQTAVWIRSGDVRWRGGARDRLHAGPARR